MKLFLDTEFTGLHKNTTLISIGIISEDGRTFYAEFTDYDKSQVDDWIQENVINNLRFNDKNHDYVFVRSSKDCDIYTNFDRELKDDKEGIEIELVEWLGQFDSVEIWSDCLAYDWVLFCDIFGEFLPSLPEYICYIPFDICTMFKLKGIDPDISREEFINNSVEGEKHNALYDAKVIKACYDKLIGL